MDPTNEAFVKGVITFLMVSGTVMIGFRMWVKARQHRPPELEKMVEALREENMRLQGELDLRMGELEERLDFVERRLVQERQAARLPEPPSRTPV